MMTAICRSKITSNSLRNVSEIAKLVWLNYVISFNKFLSLFCKDIPWNSYIQVCLWFFTSALINLIPTNRRKERTWAAKVSKNVDVRRQCSLLQPNPLKSLVNCTFSYTLGGISSPLENVISRLMPSWYISILPQSLVQYQQGNHFIYLIFYLE